MKLQAKSLIMAAAAAAFAGTASAQVMTEIRISTSSFDEEYLELQGAPGQSTDGLMFCSVESDTIGFIGFLDGVFDLSGGTFDANGLYTIGNDTAITADPAPYDIAFSGIPGAGFSGGATTTDVMENSSQTYYLLSVPDLNQRIDVINLSNSDVRIGMTGSTTIFSNTAGITILDVVCAIEDVAAVPYDGAPVIGPSGNFEPAGIYRPGGCQSGWCTDSLIKFSLTAAAVAPDVEPTPGAMNPTSVMCTTVPGVGAGACGGSGGIGMPSPMCTVIMNSTGAPGQLTAVGSTVAAANNVTLQASDIPALQFGFFLNSMGIGFLPTIGTNGRGNLCLDSTSTGRFNRAGEILQVSSLGSASLTIDLTDIPTPTSIASVNAGDTWYFQFWYRDREGTLNVSNLTNGLEITFQ